MSKIVLRMEPYNPDAVDGDGDGIVQEWTPWERPGGTRIIDGTTGKEFEAGSTANARLPGIKIVDKDGKEVNYTPTYAGGSKEPPTGKKAPKAKRKPTPLGEHGAPSLNELGMRTVREAAAPPPPQPKREREKFPRRESGEKLRDRKKGVLRSALARWRSSFGDSYEIEAASQRPFEEEYSDSNYALSLVEGVANSPIRDVTYRVEARDYTEGEIVDYPLISTGAKMEDLVGYESFQGEFAQGAEGAVRGTWIRILGAPSQPQMVGDKIDDREFITSGQFRVVKVESFTPQWENRPGTLVALRGKRKMVTLQYVGPSQKVQVDGRSNFPGGVIPGTRAAIDQHNKEVLDDIRSTGDVFCDPSPGFTESAKGKAEDLGWEDRVVLKTFAERSKESKERLNAILEALKFAVSEEAESIGPDPDLWPLHGGWAAELERRLRKAKVSRTMFRNAFGAINTSKEARDYIARTSIEQLTQRIGFRLERTIESLDESTYVDSDETSLLHLLSGNNFPADGFSETDPDDLAEALKVTHMTWGIGFDAPDDVRPAIGYRIPKDAITRSEHDPRMLWEHGKRNPAVTGHRPIIIKLKQAVSDRTAIAPAGVVSRPQHYDDAAAITGNIPLPATEKDRSLLVQAFADNPDWIVDLIMSEVQNERNPSSGLVHSIIPGAFSLSEVDEIRISYDELLTAASKTRFKPGAPDVFAGVETHPISPDEVIAELARTGALEGFTDLEQDWLRQTLEEGPNGPLNGLYRMAAHQRASVMKEKFEAAGVNFVVHHPRRIDPFSDSPESKRLIDNENAEAIKNAKAMAEKDISHSLFTPKQKLQGSTERREAPLDPSQLADPREMIKVLPEGKLRDLYQRFSTLYSRLEELSDSPPQREKLLAELAEIQTELREIHETLRNYLLNPRLAGENGPVDLLNQIWQMAGYRDLPKTVSLEEFKEKVLSGEWKMLAFRGVKDGEGITAEEIYNQFLTGDLYQGEGTFGNGTYFSVTLEEQNYLLYTQEGKEQLDADVNWAWSIADRYAGSDGSPTLAVAITRDAKGLLYNPLAIGRHEYDEDSSDPTTLNDIQEEFQVQIQKDMEYFEERIKDLWSKFGSSVSREEMADLLLELKLFLDTHGDLMLVDQSVIPSLLGYDFMYTYLNEDPCICLLNRGKVVGIIDNPYDRTQVPMFSMQ